MNDEGQRLGYYNAIKEILTQQRDDALSTAENAFKNNDKQSVAQYQSYLTQLDQNLADVDAEAQSYAKGYFKTVEGFNEGKRQGDAGRQNFFATSSPNAFQSSQATSQQYGNNKYLEGLTDLADQGNDATGLDYLNAFDKTTGTSSGQLSTGSQFGRNVGSINTQRKGLEDNFNVFREGALNSYQDTQTKIGQQYQTGLSNQSESLGQVDLSQNKNPFQYGVQSTTPYKAPAANMSAYTPYTTFSSLSNPTTTGSTYQKPVGTNAFSQQGIEQWLGQTGTNLNPKQKNDWFQKNLQGKYGM